MAADYNDTFKNRLLMLPVSSPVADQVALETISFDESVPELGRNAPRVFQESVC